MDLFKDLTLNSLQIIQLMLAPAIMISACGLLILGINNKYSLVINRIRLLNEEKRELLLKFAAEPTTTEVNVRIESISNQINDLVNRARLVRNSVLSYTSAVALFVGTSLLLGVASVMSMGKLNYFIIASFLCGMASVLVGVVFAGMETKKGYDIVLYEVKAHE